MVLRTTAVLAAIFLFLGYVLARFPSTRGLSRDMVGFALSPIDVLGNGIVNNIPSLVFLVVLFFVFRVALRLIRLFFGAVESGAVRFSNSIRRGHRPRTSWYASASSPSPSSLRIHTFPARVRRHSRGCRCSSASSSRWALRPPSPT